jgi:aminoglycoside phosphotransferase (APT) family kinase protein
MPAALVSLLAESEVMYKSAWAGSRTVLRISETLVVKITSSESTIHEGRTLSYLQKHSPKFPAPKLHGLMKFGEHFLLFTTFEGSHDLGELWPHLDSRQKRSISTQLASIMSQLRSIPHPEDAPIGKVGGWCEDIRRGSHISHQAIMDTQQFDGFIFSGATRATPTYLRFLRDFVPSSSTQCVFTHGDIKPGNIIVDQDADLNWKVVAIIDWENSGFYPEYWESIKMTNNLTPRDDDDWYLHLPEPFSPHQYPVRWLLDRILDMTLQHS